jgi:hypothetical protein
MASRKEEKERLRRARLEAEQQGAAAARRRLWLGYGVAGLLTAVVVVGIIVVVAGSDGGGGTASADGGAAIDLTTGSAEGLDPDERAGTQLPASAQSATNLKGAAKRAGCELRQDLDDEGNAHLSPDSPLPDYKTNPPTSGDHGTDPTADGAYLTTPSPFGFVHALEHGRVEIQYDPSLPEADQLAIKGVFDLDPNGMLLFPNPDLGAAVSASAWTQLMTCETYEGEETLAALVAFRSEYRGRGPEAVPF